MSTRHGRILQGRWYPSADISDFVEVASKPSADSRYFSDGNDFARPPSATAQKIPSARCPCSCGGFERHAVALALEEVDRAPRDPLAVLSIVVIGTQLSIDRVIREDMVRRA